MNNALHASLLGLYQAVQIQVKIAKQNGELIAVPHERIRATDLDFTTGNTSFRQDWDNIEYFDIFRWPSPAFNTCYEKLKALPEVEEAVQLIYQAYNIPEDRQLNTKLFFQHAFLSPLMNRIPNDAINDNNIERFLTTFINDYDIGSTTGLYTLDIKIWMCSFDLQGSEVVLEDAIIRRPMASELTVTRQRSAHVEEFDKMTGRSIPAPTILQFTALGKNQATGMYGDDVQNEIESRLDVLRLFKPGNVYVFNQSVVPRSIIEYKSEDSPAVPFDKSWVGKLDHRDTSNYDCWVQEHEVEDLIKFYSKLKPILKSISPKKYLNGSYLEIAVHRYKDALLKSEVNVNRLISAVSSVEALLSKKGSEITFKICIRVAALMRHFDFDTIKVFDKLKVAYDVRSTILHGSELSQDQIDFANEHTHEIVNYSRICLLTCLQLQQLRNKTQLINVIDQSLISDVHFKELVTLINENVFVPIVYPFRSFEKGDSFMKKKIVCIGWGSLIWKPGNLKFKGEWQSHGPLLPIEFTRISNDGRVTLIIDKKAKSVRTFYRIMETHNLDEAKAALKIRENDAKIEMVTSTEICDGPIKKAIVDWLRLNNIDAAIWTAVGYGNGKVRPTVEEIIKHLKTLQGQTLTDAEEYIRKAPKQINTEYRKRIEEDLGWTPID